MHSTSLIQGGPGLLLTNWGIPELVCTEWGIPELVRTKWGIPHLVCPPHIRGSHRLLCQQTEQGNLLVGILRLLLALRSFTCYQLGAALWQLQCGDVYSDLEALSCSIQRLRAGSAEIGQIVNGRTFCFPYFDLVKRTFGGWTKQKSSPPNHDLNWQRYKIDSLALSCRTRTSSNSMHFISLSSTIIT